jgi:glycogen synthase
MLRVLHLIYDDPENPWVAGGGSVRVREIYRRLSGRVSVTVATGSYPGAEDVREGGVRYVRLGKKRPYAWSRLSYARAAGRMLRTAEYDVAVFDFSTYTPVRIPADLPIGITVHHLSAGTASERWGRLAGALIGAQERRVLRRARVFSATSGATSRLLREVVGPDVIIENVPAGVPDELFELQRREGDYLLYFGRIDWFQKGLDTLLEAFRQLTRTRPSLQLKVAGRGKDMDRLRTAVQDFGLDRNVQLLGAVTDDERNELFRGALALLMPSRFEGFGMVAAEGMAAGVPVVAAASGSLPEVIGGEGGGVLVPPREPAALAAAVEALLSQPGTRERLSRSARESAERFRWDRVAEQHLLFLHSIRNMAAPAAARRSEEDGDEDRPLPR